jgi:hypothetical protein
LPGENFNTILYDDGAGAKTGVGFQPDLVWVKARASDYEHELTDSVRGITKAISSDSSNAETTDSTGLTAFGTDGFTVGADTNYSDTTGTGMVSWSWKSGGTPTATNVATTGVMTSGSVFQNGVSNTSFTPGSTIYPEKISANTTAGFSIVQYVGTGSGATIAHGLSQAPDMVISKGMTDAYNWRMGGEKIGLTSANYSIRFDLVNAEQDLSGVFGAFPGASVWTIGDDAGVNASTDNYIAYCFHSIEGYSQVGSYVGNGSDGDGNFLYCGFRPQYVMFKEISASNGAAVIDSKRNPYNLADLVLRPTYALAVYDYGSGVDFVSNGIKLKNNNGMWNDNAATYMFYAIAESPFKTANAR